MTARAFATTLGVVLGALLACLVLVGFSAWRASGSARTADPFLHHALRAGFSGFETWGEARVPYSVNNLGFRDRRPREVQRKFEAGTRTLLLGDSFVEGLGLSYDDSLASALETRLARKGRPAEVLNGAVASYSPFLEARALRRFFEKGFETDSIVLFLDISDVQDEGLGTYEGLGEDGAFPPWWRRKVSALTHEPQGFWETLLFRTKVERDNYYEARDRWTEDDALWDRYGRQGLARCREGVLRIRELAHHHGAHLRLCIYPWPTQIRSARNPSRAETEFLRLGSDAGIPVTNTFPLFRADQDWNSNFLPGDVHWSKAGAILVADALIKDLMVP